MCGEFEYGVTDIFYHDDALFGFITNMHDEDNYGVCD